MIKQMILVLFTAAIVVSCATTTAYIYKNKKTGELLYCKNDQGDDLKDFTFVSTAVIDENLDIRLCELENN
jgi:hypothetical protein